MNQVYLYHPQPRLGSHRVRAGLNPFMNQVYLYKQVKDTKWQKLARRLNPFMNQVYLYAGGVTKDAKGNFVLIPL